MTSLKRLTLTTLLVAATLQTSFAATPPEDTVSNSTLNSALFYQLLVGEMSAQNGDTTSAYSLMLDAARKGNSERLYERAVELALASRNGESALQAAQAWARVFSKSTEANRYVIQILVGLNKLTELPEAIQRGMWKAPDAATVERLTRLLVDQEA